MGEKSASDPATQEIDSREHHETQTNARTERSFEAVAASLCEAREIHRIELRRPQSDRYS